jgi:hypothetical protein
VQRLRDLRADRLFDLGNRLRRVDPENVFRKQIDSLQSFALSVPRDTNLGRRSPAE